MGRRTGPRVIAALAPHPQVLNKMMTPVWTSRTLIDVELISAVHVFFLKARIPSSVCPRETFISWANEIVERYPSNPLHCAR